MSVVEPAAPTSPSAPAWTRPRLTRYRPGIGLPVGLVGVGLLALSLFGLTWIDGGGGSFVDISRSIRHVGSARADDTLLFAYGSWGAFAAAAVVTLFVLAAGLPVPSTSGGNTWPRVVGALVAGSAAVVHAIFLRDLFAGPMAPQLGAWCGLAGYLVAGCGIALGARRISASY